VSARRALVTGATGGLGLSLCAALHASGYSVRATGRNAALAARLGARGAAFVQADLLTADLAALCQDIDVVFHAAALSSPWGPSEAFTAINVTATHRLLNAASAAGADCFVFVSSPSIYAALWDQADLTEDSPLPARALNAYARTKRIAEKAVLGAHAPGFTTIAVRPRALIGPDDTVLLPRIVTLAARGWFPSFRGGRALIELTDVRDAAAALVLADQRRDRAKGQAINISGAKPLSVATLVARLGQALGKPVRLRPIPLPLALGIAGASEALCACLPHRPEPRLTRYGVATLAFTQTFDLTRARSVLGYRPAHDAVDSAAALAASYGQANP
jgi:2-alkyl-3-oxoalkanoate reductase